MSTWAQPGAPPAAWQGPEIDEVQTAANPLIPGRCVFRRAEPALAFNTFGTSTNLRATIHSSFERLQPRPTETFSDPKCGSATDLGCTSDQARFKSSPCS